MLERRKRRSRFRSKALRYLLESRAQQDGLAFLLLASEQGKPLACSGQLCDPNEIAAVAPILVDGSRKGKARMFGHTIRVELFSGPGFEFYVCTTGDRLAHASFAPLAACICRILGPRRLWVPFNRRCRLQKRKPPC